MAAWALVKQQQSEACASIVELDARASESFEVLLSMGPARVSSSLATITDEEILELIGRLRLSVVSNDHQPQITEAVNRWVHGQVPSPHRLPAPDAESYTISMITDAYYVKVVLQPSWTP